ncbi:MAG: VOC family protein [Myxococcota bacterium]|nr:VOC family protein [Myxococcota bacterium]MEE2673975.1 VOC family protein [Myxococcota bacterium]
MNADDVVLETSHLIVHVADTDATIDFWCGELGGAIESDEELEAPALDAMFGREGVRIRDTFIRVGGIRLHTIETLDERRKYEPAAQKYPLGLGGVSFRVADLDAAHTRAESAGREPTPIFAFSEIDPPVRMFFLEDPDGIRVEMIEGGS